MPVFGELDDLARPSGRFRYGRRICVGSDEIAVGRQDQAEWSTQMFRIGKDNVASTKIAVCCACALQRENLVIQFRGNIKDIAVAVVRESGRAYYDCGRIEAEPVAMGDCQRKTHNTEAAGLERDFESRDSSVEDIGHKQLRLISLVINCHPPGSVDLI